MLNTPKNEIDITGAELTYAFISIIVQDTFEKTPKDSILSYIKNYVGEDELKDQAFDLAEDKLKDLMVSDAEFFKEMNEFSYKVGFSNDYIFKLEQVVADAFLELTKDADILVDQITL